MQYSTDDATKPNTTPCIPDNHATNNQCVFNSCWRLWYLRTCATQRTSRTLTPRPEPDNLTTYPRGATHCIPLFVGIKPSEVHPIGSRNVVQYRVRECYCTCHNRGNDTNTLPANMLTPMSLQVELRRLPCFVVHTYQRPWADPSTMVRLLC